MEKDKAVLQAILEAQREAGELIMHAHNILAENKADHRNVVTEYDRQVQQLLVDRLSKAVPGAGFFCEESDSQDDLTAGEVFIIDPIDGTMNFVRGFNHSAISVAYLRQGAVHAGAVYNPYMDEQFYALKGQGAWLSGKAISCGDAELSESVVCCGTAPYNPELADRSFELMKKAFLTGLDIRRQGAAALDMCSVAAGRAGVYFELNVSPWDIAAGMLIVQEAGGVCLDIEGRPLPMDGAKSTILAGNPRAAGDFLRMVGG